MTARIGAVLLVVVLAISLNILFWRFGVHVRIGSYCSGYGC